MLGKCVWPALVLAVLSGCVTSSGYNRNLLEARLREDGNKVIDKDIKQITRLEPQLRFPCRIAVALREGAGHWRWTPRDRQVMDTWAANLRKEGIASDVVFMSNLFADGDSLQHLRASAAKYGADALLVVKGTAVTDSRINALAVLNLTVVGGFVVPGSHRDAMFQIEAALVDVNNGFLYASADVQGEGSTLAPTFLIEEKDCINCAKQEALAAFGPELMLRMRNLRASTVAIAERGAPAP
jgi:hypothetical protein